MKTLAAVLSMLVLAAAAVSAAGCGETVLDSQKLEETLPHDLRSSVTEPVKAASCPSDIEVEKGKVFSCEVTLESGEEEVAELKFLNDEADYGIVAIKPKK